MDAQQASWTQRRQRESATNMDFNDVYSQADKLKVVV